MLVGVTLVLRAVVASRWSWQDDDWRLMNWAVVKPFGSYYLMNYNGHLLPGGFLLTWAVTMIAPLDRSLVVGLTALASAVAVVIWAFALREVFGERRRLLLVLALLSLTPLALRPAMWWTAAILMLPLHVATGLCVCFTARYARRLDRSSLIGVVAAFVGGLVFWEKALLLVIPITGVLLFCSPHGVIRTLRRAWPLVAAVALTALGYLLLYLRLTTPKEGQKSLGFDPTAWPGLARAAGLYRDAATQALFPAALGGPWGTTPVLRDPLAEPGRASMVICAVTVLALLGAAVRLRRRAWIPLAMGGGYAFVVASLVLFSNRAHVFGDLAIREERYTVDIVAIGALAAAMLITPGAHESPATAFRRRVPAALTSTPTFVCASVALAISLLIGNGLLMSRVGVSPGRAWLDHVLTAVDAKAPVNLYDAAAPGTVFPPIGGEGTLSHMLSPLGDKVTFNRSDRPLMVVDGDGHLKPARIDDDSHAAPGPVPNCGYAMHPGETRTLTMSSHLFDYPWGLQVTAFAGAGGVLRIDIDGRATDIAIGRGFARHQAVVSTPVHTVRLGLLPGSQPVCVTELIIGLVKPGTGR